MKPKASRQRIKHLRVPVLPDEMTEIKIKAAGCGLTVAAYLRSLGLNHSPKTVLDAKAVAELVKVNADEGRLGGLLKMLLTNKERMRYTNKNYIDALISQIQRTQDLLYDAARKI